MIEFVTFALIIDDIVFPDGRTAMRILGGGGPQTAFGMKLWTDHVGLVSGVGRDLPDSAWDWFQAMGIDTEGLSYSRAWPTPRAWQFLEKDGHRIQVWQSPKPVISHQLGRSLDRLPPAYGAANNFHLGVHPETPDLEFIQAVRDKGAVVSIEPFRPPHRPLTESYLHLLLTAGQIFSPNHYEAQALVGSGPPLDLVRRLARAGAEVVALRQGAGGAIVHRADTGETWHISAFETPVVDPTGAGNAFCGGFLVGWVQTADLCLAGLYGSVAASFLVEQVGLPPPRPEIRTEARRRLEILTAKVTQAG